MIENRGNALNRSRSVNRLTGCEHTRTGRCGYLVMRALNYTHRGREPKLCGKVGNAQIIR